MFPTDDAHMFLFDACRAENGQEFWELFSACDFPEVGDVFARFSRLPEGRVRASFQDVFETQGYVVIFKEEEFCRIMELPAHVVPQLWDKDFLLVHCAIDDAYSFMMKVLYDDAVHFSQDFVEFRWPYEVHGLLLSHQQEDLRLVVRFEYYGHAGDVRCHFTLATDLRPGTARPFEITRAAFDYMMQLRPGVRFQYFNVDLEVQIEEGAAYFFLN